MARNHIQQGAVMPWTNQTGADVASGAPVAIGDLVGVALGDIADGAKGELALAEVWELNKTSSAIAQGTRVYLTPGGSITATESGNTPAGWCFEDAADGAATALVLLGG